MVDLHSYISRPPLLCDVISFTSCTLWSSCKVTWAGKGKLIAASPTVLHKQHRAPEFCLPNVQCRSASAASGNAGAESPVCIRKAILSYTTRSLAVALLWLKSINRGWTCRLGAHFTPSLSSKPPCKVRRIEVLGTSVRS